MAKRFFKNFTLELSHKSNSVGRYSQSRAIIERRQSFQSFGVGFVQLTKHRYLLLIQVSKLTIKITIQTSGRMFCFLGHKSIWEMKNELSNQILIKHTEEEHKNGSSHICQTSREHKIASVVAGCRPDWLFCVIILHLRSTCILRFVLPYRRSESLKKLFSGEISEHIGRRVSADY